MKHNLSDAQKMSGKRHSIHRKNHERSAQLQCAENLSKAFGNDDYENILHYLKKSEIYNEKMVNTPWQKQHFLSYTQKR